MIRDIYIKGYASGGGGVTRSTATLMKTGQTTSYITGDDGDLQAGRDTDFFTLDAAPLHDDGSATLNTTTNRFTDILGGQTYTDDIVLDWSTWNGSTLLGFDKNFTLKSNWNTAIDDGLTHSISPFISGWRLGNVHEQLSLFNIGLVSRLNYAPINFSLNTLFISSSTIITANTNYFSPITNTISGGTLAVNRSKLSNGYTIFFKTFTLSTSNILS